jgi:hypothetical protein
VFESSDCGPRPNVIECADSERSHESRLSFVSSLGLALAYSHINPDRLSRSPHPINSTAGIGGLVTLSVCGGWSHGSEYQQLSGD